MESPENLRRNRLAEMGLPGFGNNPPARNQHTYTPPPNDNGIDLGHLDGDSMLAWGKNSPRGNEESQRTPGTHRASTRRLIYGLVGALLVSIGGNYCQWKRENERADSDRMMNTFIDRKLRENDGLESENRHLRWELIVERQAKERLESLLLNHERPLPQDPHPVPRDRNDSGGGGNSKFSLTD